NCRMAGVKFLSAGGSGSLDDAVSSMQYVSATGFKVSNNSWGGGGFSQAMFDAIQAAGDNFGHIFVAAAGNGGSYGASYPAAYTCTNIIAVGACDVDEGLASFTQYHPTEVDIAAPGVGVVSTVLGNSYDSYSGTSMATPHVAGVTAMVYSLMGGNDADVVRDIVLNTARPSAPWSGNCATGGIVDLDAALDATFLGPKITLVSSVPVEADPNTPLGVQITIDPREDVLVPGSVKLHYRNELGGWSSMDMNHDGGDAYSGSVPGYGCDDTSGFFLSCQGVTDGLVQQPSGGSANAYSWTIGTVVVAYEDNGQTNGDWSVETTALDGGWNRGVPVNCQRGDPPADFDGSGACWLTDNSSADSCNSDVDEGSTMLMSGVIDISGVQNAQLSYARWFHNSFGASPYTDSFVVQMSVNGGGWTTLETVGPNGADVDGGWVNVTWDLADLAPGADTIQLRFTASDIGGDTQSVVEAGVDAIRVAARECDDQPVCPGDIDGSGSVDVDDLLMAIAGFGDDYTVDDVLTILAHFGSNC
ncbi:MAG: S8 family serine peptidase, partial [Phycisphaerales bacterium]|nr:S8 family serine peptidase [Phycisphaerales bacterium]